MNPNNFSELLRRLMKERHISGQKIADQVGMSQKTISRYATGEIVPTDEVKKSLLEAIAIIGGHPEDAEFKNRKVMFESLSEILNSGIELRSEEDILQEENWECEQDLELACKAFSILSKENQKFIINYFDTFSNLDGYEIAIVECFTKLSDEEKKFLIDSMETVHFSMNDISDQSSICEKISNYMIMTNKCNQIKIEDIDKWEDNNS